MPKYYLVSYLVSSLFYLIGGQGRRTCGNLKMFAYQIQTLSENVCTFVRLEGPV